ncbi:MAG: carboxymuconolactone decarboxylase family protein [Anaerolineae bacterium]|nr:carboxymuconolactone decarboxylase family protein [Anaerolineae bacterium]
MFIEPISPSEAAGVIKALYEAEEKDSGYIPNYLKLFSHRPEVYQAWQQLGAAIRANMSFRRYELVTLAAARKLTGTYCMLAHSDNFLNSGEVDEAQLAAIATDYHTAGLTPDEVAVMEFAEKIIVNSSSVTQADVDRLRGFGLSDAEILDVGLAASARSFFSKTLDTFNAEPDAKYLSFGPALCKVLAVGRPFGDTEKV